jgi:XTP/dITP diphosphohydrolase
MGTQDTDTQFVVVVASNNAKKAAEMRSLLPGRFVVRTASQAGVEMPEETGETFADNALLKARAAARQTGTVAIADDSGLVVDALGGDPGVRSARYAADNGRPATDDENNRLLLEKLTGVAERQRTARFVSAVAIVTPEGDQTVCHGTVEGLVGAAPVGSGGFGYDPLFYPTGFDRTMAELDPDEKNQISHRGKAFREAVPVILRQFGIENEQAET